MALPEITPEMREAALAKAAEARKARSEALAEVRHGTLAPADALVNPGPLQRAKVRQVLMAVPGIGAVRADKLMAEAKIDASRRVAGLGAVQRKALLFLLAA